MFYIHYIQGRSQGGAGYSPEDAPLKEKTVDEAMTINALEDGDWENEDQFVTGMVLMELPSYFYNLPN